MTSHVVLWTRQRRCAANIAWTIWKYLATVFPTLIVTVLFYVHEVDKSWGCGSLVPIWYVTLRSAIPSAWPSDPYARPCAKDSYTYRLRDDLYGKNFNLLAMNSIGTQRFFLGKGLFTDRVWHGLPDDIPIRSKDVYRIWCVNDRLETVRMCCRCSMESIWSKHYFLCLPR